MARDRRQHPRFGLMTDVECSDGRRTVVVPTRDVGLGGVFLFTVSPDEVDTPVSLVLHVPGGGDVVVGGRVAHRLQRIGMGIQFQRFEGDGRRTLERFLEALPSCTEVVVAESEDGTVRPGDRRAHPRIALETSIHVTSASNFYAGLTNDVGEGGLFVAGLDPAPVGSAVDLEFSLPDDGPPIRVVGEVRWVRDDNTAGGCRRGMGIRFTDLEPDDMRRINAFTNIREPLLYEEA